MLVWTIYGREACHNIFYEKKKKYSFFFNNDNLSYEFYEKVSCGTIR